MNRHHPGRWLVVAGLALTACSTAYLHSQIAPHAALSAHARIAVLPLAGSSAPRAEPSQGNQIAPGADAVVTKALYDTLTQGTTFEIIDRSKVEQAVAASAGPPSTPAALQALAGTLGAEAILRGAIALYRERDGSHLSVNRPAAVGIELWLTGGQDGRLLWHGSYYETQRSFTEEVRTLPLYWKRGARWLTAEELADYAVTELVNAMPHGQGDGEKTKAE